MILSNLMSHDEPACQTSWSYIISFESYCMDTQTLARSSLWMVVASAGPYAHNMHLAPTPHDSIFTGHMLFLTPNQQCQSTEGRNQCIRN